MRKSISSFMRVSLSSSPTLLSCMHGYRRSDGLHATSCLESSWEENVEDSKEEVSEPRFPKRRRLIRLETSEEPDEQEVRKRQSREEISAVHAAVSG